MRAAARTFEGRRHQEIETDADWRGTDARHQVDGKSVGLALLQARLGSIDIRAVIVKQMAGLVRHHEDQDAATIF